MPDPGVNDWDPEKSGFDDWMDSQLREVSVPRDFHARLRGVRPSAEETAATQASGRDPVDARVDALLRNVEVPEGFHRRLRAIARRQLLPAAWRQVPPKSLASKESK